MISRKFKKRNLAFLFLVIFPSIAYATTSVHTKYDYYDIYGKTENELRRQMNEKGYKDANGKTYDAHTQWFVKWNYNYQNQGSGCSIGSIQTSTEIIFKFPKWQDMSSSPQALQNKWQSYMKALELHEEGHKAIGIQAMQEIDQSIARMDSANSCQEIGAQANALGNKILEKYRKDEIDYDAQTRHGKTQGAVFS